MEPPGRVTQHVSVTAPRRSGLHQISIPPVSAAGSLKSARVFEGWKFVGVWCLDFGVSLALGGFFVVKSSSTEPFSLTIV
jgi:hypothetical protein